METVFEQLIGLAERNVLPDSLVRIGMRQLIAQRLSAFETNGVEKQQEVEEKFIDQLKTMPIAINTADANEQHYEVPTELYKICLGPRLKYSCAYYKTATDTLTEAELNMFELYVERAQLGDGKDMRILDLGCGWGALSLFLCERFPQAQIFACSNSSTQKAHIDSVAAAKGFRNLTVFTCDINEFDFLAFGGETRAPLDRILSIEMFEHMKNYERLLRNVSSWLKRDGLLFVHIFTFAHHSYHYEVASASDWMTQYFFAGGTMPHAGLLARFQTDLQLQRQWAVNGRHYSRTLEAWLVNCDANVAPMRACLAAAYGADKTTLWLARWRMFFMACSELFAYAGGNQWFVSHYLFKKTAIKN